ncbi:MAG: HAD-IIIA family hydrolase [Paludibacteraceae bacterium]|nr:HAD-IIIA family hydrolase [Paludibacteraceae bacterium]
MTFEAIILAGGFGTRLSHVLGNVPKPMAPVAGFPFLSYLIRRLEQAGVSHVVLATGHMHDVVASYFGSQYGSVHIDYARETSPLLTGGAIMNAMRLCLTEDVMVLNGDTLFEIDFRQFHSAHCQSNANVSVALRPVEDVARYGAVELSGMYVSHFVEKGRLQGVGLINGGIYIINRAWYTSLVMPEAFSFEKQILEVMSGEMAIHAQVFENYFIDIGIPEDYHRAQKEFPMYFESATDLFLDRDGVLNRLRVGDYVKRCDEFEWLPGAREALALLSRRFRHIFVVTNQQGVSKGLFDVADLESIHRLMLHDVEQSGGRITQIYVCTDRSDSLSPNRKPEIGMALQAVRDYPEVDLHRAVMVGDSLTDMQFAARAGMQAVCVRCGNAMDDRLRDYTDLFYDSLLDFAQHQD